MRTTRRIFLTVACALALCGVASAQMGSALVPPSSADCVATRSGSWQDAATWDGKIPQQGDRFLIPAGVTVTNHGVTADTLWGYVAGTLKVCDHCDTQINAHTIYVPHGGSFQLGKPGMPATGNVVLEFTPGPFLPGDTTKLSRGVINHGEFVVCGQEKTHADEIVADLPVGATTLQLKNVPYNWKVGDRIAIAGTDSKVGESWVVYQTEERTITAIAGQFITWAEPLVYRHFRWAPDLPFHCVNESRNVVIRSRDPAVNANRGHLMSMSAQMQPLYCLLEGLGRTDKSQPVTDPRTDLYGELVAGSDANPRARYALHWHRAGAMGPPALCRGVVVDGSPGWGILNHNSNVQVDDCVATRCFGFGFGTEEGQERGHFRRCFGFLNRGQGDTISSGDADHGIRLAADWGKDGSGFWLQGGLVEVSDCVAFDNSGRGFALFNRSMNSYPAYGTGTNRIPEHLQYPIQHAGALLPVEFNGIAFTPSSTVPQRVFARNTAYGNKLGCQGWSGPTHDSSSNRIWPLTVRGNITDLAIWGRGGKLNLEYTRQANITGLRIVGDNAFRAAYNSLNKNAEAVLLRGAEVTISDWDIQHVQFHVREFSVAGANDPVPPNQRNIVIEGRTVQPGGSVTVP
jgi:hypothetical protein